MIFPFSLGEKLTFILSLAADLELSADSAGSQHVTIRL